MFTKVIGAMITNLELNFLWNKKQTAKDPGKAGWDASPPAEPDQNKDELDDARVAEVFAIWNWLHPHI